MSQRNSSPYQNSIHNLQKMIYTLQKHLKTLKNSYIMIEQDFAYLQIWMHERGILGLINSMSIIFSNDLKSAIKLQELQNHHLFNNFTINDSFDSNAQKHIHEGECKIQQQNLSEIQNQSKNMFNEMEQSDQESNRKQYKRGPYKNYTTEEKQKAVRMLLQDHLSVIDISRKLAIPCKNIKRWSQQGIQRKKGGGRKKFSPETQKAVAAYFKMKYPQNSEVNYEEVQETARNMSQDENFKASRGWVVKFVDRQNLKNYFKFI